MKLQAIRVVDRRAPMAASVSNANRRWTQREGLWVGLRDDNGLWGQGEASPLPGYCRDDLHQARRAIAAWESHGLPALELAPDPLRAIELALRTVADDTPSARFALEAALLDLASQHLHTSVARLLGARGGTVPVARLLDVFGGSDTVACDPRLASGGPASFKVKIGAQGRWNEELQCLRALRQRLGPSVQLRLDANRSLAGPALQNRLQALAEVHPEFLEEPAPPHEIAAVPSVPFPLALDESLQEPQVLASLPRWLTRYQVVVLKPMALGGVLRCRSLAHIAREHGARAVVTHTFDGPIAWSAAAALALAVHDNAVAAGLAPHAGLTAWPAVQLSALRGDQVQDPGEPGWGFELLGPS